MTVDVSKYMPPAGNACGNNTTTVLYAHAADVPIAMSVSMFADLFLTASTKPA